MLYCITTPGLAINTYLIIDPTTNKGVVVDPTREMAPILQKIQETKTEVIAILETHVHADFVSGSRELKHRLNGLPAIYCSGLGGPKWTADYADNVVEDRFEFSLGSIRLQAWHTPGHTPEHIMWVIYDESKNKTQPIQALTGDFLLVGSLGRPDLLGEENTKELSDQFYQSVFNLLPQLPDSLEIYPAHGAGSLCGKGIGNQPSSTLGWERQNNPFLKQKPKEEWIEDLLINTPQAPFYFSRMKEVNIAGPQLLEELPPVKELPLGQIAQANLAETLIVDLRSKEAFAEKHIAKSINVPFGPSFINWAPLTIPYDQPLLLIATNQADIQPAIDRLQWVGLIFSSYFAVWNPETQASLQEPVASFPLISPHNLQSKLHNNSGLVVVDVRTISEWQAGHIAEAQHISITDFSKQLKQLPKDRPIALICGSGYRASIAASLLQQQGYGDVCNVQGGMQEWIKAQLPTIKS